MFRTPIEVEFARWSPKNSLASVNPLSVEFTPRKPQRIERLQAIVQRFIST
jgi:hypothetical protein